MAVEEQTSYDDDAKVRSGVPRTGQKLPIPPRTVTKLGFWVYKIGAPAGDLTFAIRLVSTDVAVLSKVWGDISALPTEVAYREVTFDSPAALDGDYYLSCEYDGGDAGNCVELAFNTSDVKAGENCYYYTDSWVDWAPRDLAYRYTYEEPPAPAAGGGPASLVAAGII